jgi:acetylornithine/succinyldiaminopimelate/putrescine aminotransferase
LIWSRALGSRVWDANGREYIDLTGGFGVAVLGHSDAGIAAAIAAQPVTHALGDLAEAEVTSRLRSALPWPAKLAVTGEDAVEVGLRTALLATGRPGIVAFENAYHGAGLLALAATGIERFRRPFAPWLPGPVHRRTYGVDPGPLPPDTCCVVVEPVQGRGGALVPPPEFLPTLRTRCDDAGALLVVDAIFTGIGRLGEMWPGAGVADILCVGKALGAGLPLSAALFVNERVASVWEVDGEDLYTHTHVGNPLACAAALIVLEEVPRLLPRVRELSGRFAAAGWNGAGLLRTRRQDAADAADNGVLVIPIPARGGRDALVQAAPAYTIADDELDEAFARLSC